MVKTKIYVQVSDGKASGDPADLIVTYSLGSCIGVCLYDQDAKIGGLLHFQLPESKMSVERAREKPFMFVDTGLTLLIQEMERLGAVKRRLSVKIAGGAAMNNGPKGFDIGKRNGLAIRKLAWKQGLFLDAEEVGGFSPRNLSLDIEDGTVVMRCNGLEKTL